MRIYQFIMGIPIYLYPEKPKVGTEEPENRHKLIFFAERCQMWGGARSTSG